MSRLGDDALHGSGCTIRRTRELRGITVVASINVDEDGEEETLVMHRHRMQGLTIGLAEKVRTVTRA
jgi:hypothetical protein